MLRLSAEADILFLCCHQLLELLLAQLSVAVPIKLCKHRLDLLLAKLLRHLVSKAVFCDIVLLKSGMPFRKIQSVSGIRTDLSKFFPCDEAVSILVKELEGSLCL